jgi:hypothetical protein
MCEVQEEQTIIDLNEQVNLTFALRYLASFTKATSLSPTVVSFPLQGLRSLAVMYRRALWPACAESCSLLLPMPPACAPACLPPLPAGDQAEP